jgi:hypothetical protein
MDYATKTGFKQEVSIKQLPSIYASLRLNRLDFREILCRHTDVPENLVSFRQALGYDANVESGRGRRLCRDQLTNFLSLAPPTLTLAARTSGSSMAI